MNALLLALFLAASPDGHYLGTEALGGGGGTMTGDLTLNDDVSMCLGSSCQYYLRYNSTGTQFELWTTDADGGGTDQELLTCGDGADACTFLGLFTASGGLAIDADSVALTLGAAGSSDSSLLFDGTNLVINTSGVVDFQAPIQTGTIEVTADSGEVPLWNMEVTAGSGSGTPHSLCAGIDSNCMLKVYGESDGAGAADTLMVYALEPIKHDTQLATSGLAEPFTCDAATEGAMQYVDDTDDTAYARVCICANLDGTGYDWRDLGDIVGTACPFY